MRAYETWLTVVVAAAFGAGLLSFVVATPDQGSRVSDHDLGFARLDDAHVDRSLEHAARHHRSAHRSLVGARAATSRARAWLDGLPGSTRGSRNAATDVSIAPGSDAAARRVGAFVRWADDLPARRWRATTGIPVAVAGVDRTWTISGEVQVDVAQSTQRARRQVVPVELVVRGSVAERSGVPARWVVDDLVVGSSAGWLRAYRDPVVVGTDTVDVVAPATARSVAIDAAAVASATIAAVGARYAPAGAPEVAAIWMVERPGLVRSVTRRGVPADVRDAAEHDTHGMAWVDDRGDVIVDLSRFTDATARTRAAAIRHAMAHLATGHATEGAPALVAEGIALAEEHRVPSGAITLDTSDLQALDQAFTTRSSGIADLLVEAADATLDDAGEQRAAVATIAWMLDERGAPRVRRYVQLLDAGVAPDAALRRSLGMAPRGVERSVATWVRARLPRDTMPTG